MKEFAEVGKSVKSYEKKIVYFDQISGLDIENITLMTCEFALERALERARDEDKGIKVREIICMPFVRSPQGYRRSYGAKGV